MQRPDDIAERVGENEVIVLVHEDPTTRQIRIREVFADVHAYEVYVHHRIPPEDEDQYRTEITKLRRASARP